MLEPVSPDIFLLVCHICMLLLLTKLEATLCRKWFVGLWRPATVADRDSTAFNTNPS